MIRISMLAWASSLRNRHFTHDARSSRGWTLALVQDGDIIELDVAIEF